MDKKLVRNILNHCQLCYQEMKRINQLLLDDNSTEFIEKSFINENILQFTFYR